MVWVVTGASGFVGRAVVERLERDGTKAVSLPRQALRPEALPTALAGATGIIHCAAVVHRPEAPAEAYRFNVDSTKALLDAASRVGVRAMLLLSTIKVHGESAPQIDEQTKVDPEGPYAVSKLEAERLVREAHHLRTVIVRLCPVHGPGDKGNVRAMIRAIWRRRFFVPGSGEARKSIVHISTVAGALSALTRSSAEGTFVMADREAPTIRELADAIAEVLGRSRPRTLPLPALRLAARLIETTSRALGRETTFTSDRIRKVVSPTVCNPALLERAIGMECHVDLRHALADEVDWLRQINAL